MDHLIYYAEGNEGTTLKGKEICRKDESHDFYNMGALTNKSRRGEADANFWWTVS